jgi:hypothetical protein
MKINPYIKKPAIQFGASGGAMMILSFLVFFYLGMQPWRNLISFILDVVIIGFFLVLAIREFKIKYNSNELRFYHGMTLGFLTFFLMSGIYSVFYGLFISVVDPDFLLNYIDLAIQDLNSRKELLTDNIEGDPELFFQEQINGIKAITTSQLIFDAFIKRVLIGFFLTPMISIVFRTPQQ